MEEEKYNVYVVEVDTFKASVKIGSSLTYRQAMQRENLAMFKLNTEDFFISICPVGSERDLQLLEDLK